MDTTTQTITEFLLARIAEDEAWAAVNARPSASAGRNYARPSWCAWVLAECEAKRRRIAIIKGGWIGYNDDNILGELLALEALPYADHPDYRQAWKP